MESLFLLEIRLFSFSSILGVPWFEMGGKVTIDCEKTGYTANLEFLTKVSLGLNFMDWNFGLFFNLNSRFIMERSIKSLVAYWVRTRKNFVRLMGNGTV